MNEYESGASTSISLKFGVCVSNFRIRDKNADILWIYEFKAVID